jgi:phenylalanyl-tRNA synthetase beta chain
MQVQPEARRPAYRVRQMVADRGYQEVVNFAFVEEAWEADFAGNGDLIRLANPIASQMAVMRSSLFGGLISNLVTNLKRKQSRVRLFEVGRIFRRDDKGAVEGFDQPWNLAALAYGGASPENWGSDARKVDFYDIKGDLEAMLAPAQLRFEKLLHPALHPGRAAKYCMKESRSVASANFIRSGFKNTICHSRPLCSKLILTPLNWSRCLLLPRYPSSRP